MDKELFGVTLVGLGSIGVLAGKWGLILSLTIWLLGVMGIVSSISGWWVIGFASLLILSFISVALGISVVEG